MQDNNRVRANFNRRGILKGGAAATAGLMVPGLFWPSRSWAASSYPALGTYPAGIMRGSVLVGITVPRTGPYSDVGRDELRGYVLAIEQINAGTTSPVRGP